MVTLQFIKLDQKLNIKIDTINFSGDKNIGREIIKGLEKYKDNDAKTFLILS